VSTSSKQMPLVSSLTWPRQKEGKHTRPAISSCTNSFKEPATVVGLELFPMGKTVPRSLWKVNRVYLKTLEYRTSCHLLYSALDFSQSFEITGGKKKKKKTLSNILFLMIFTFSIIAGLQCSVNFLPHSKMTQSHTHTYIHSFCHIILHHAPSYVTRYCSQCYTAYPFQRQ